MSQILVIDDDALVRGTIRACLERAGYDVAEAGNGYLGLEALASGGIDLVIVDIFMPEMEGLQAIREIRALDTRLPIIVISGGGIDQHTNYLRMAQDFGAMAALVKPFSNSRLLQEVAMLLKPEMRRCPNPA